MSILNKNDLTISHEFDWSEVAKLPKIASVLPQIQFASRVYNDDFHTGNVIYKPEMNEAHLKIQEKFKNLESDVLPCFGGSKSRLFD